jgi:hypothetical protein
MLTRNDYTSIFRYARGNSIRNGACRPVLTKDNLGANDLMTKSPVHALAQSAERIALSKNRMSPKVGREIVGKLRPGKWYSAKIVAEDAGIAERDVHSVLHTMCWRPQHGAKAERKKIGDQIHYRVFKQDKTVSVEELTTKLRPIVEGLKAEGKKNMATMVPAEVAMLAARLERVLNEWAE